MQLLNTTRDTLLCDATRIAESFWPRTLGLMGKASLAEQSGVLISPCRRVHTAGMRFPIDVLFLSWYWRVLAISHQLRPWSLSPAVPSAFYALELVAGRAVATHTEVGDHCALVDELLVVAPADDKAGESRQRVHAARPVCLEVRQARGPDCTHYPHRRTSNR